MIKHKVVIFTMDNYEQGRWSTTKKKRVAKQQTVNKNLNIYPVTTLSLDPFISVRCYPVVSITKRLYVRA